MDVESMTEADGDRSHLAATSAEGKNKSRGREQQERAAEGTAARENDKVRVEGTTARESGGVGSDGEVGSGGAVAKGRAVDLQTTRLGEKSKVCFRDLMGGEGNVFNPHFVSYLQSTIFFGNITRYTVDPRS